MSEDLLNEYRARLEEAVARIAQLEAQLKKANASNSRILEEVRRLKEGR